MKNIFIFLLPLTFLLLPPQASAAAGMSVTPPVTEILISPNKSVSTTIQLTNDGEDTSIILSLHRLIPQGDQGHSTIDPKPLDPTSIPVVIKLVGKELGIPFKLSAGQTQAITIELEAANLDEPTDVYFAILARGVNEGASPTESQATPGITALFMATITPSASLPTNIALTPPELPIIQDTSIPLSFDVKAENKTGIMLQVQGKIKLLSPNKALISESSIDPKLILGNTSRLLSDFEFLPSNFAFGPHTLTIELSTVGGRTLTEHSYVIWMLPLRYLLVATVALVIISIPLLRKFHLTRVSIRA
ncbi:hypothetical protein KBD69_02255 [Candidatus Woesebacteria bacterium]|nr:hypothetical protein [Candidatus Woesebacteria bacterium]